MNIMIIVSRINSLLKIFLSFQKQIPPKIANIGVIQPIKNTFSCQPGKAMISLKFESEGITLIKKLSGGGIIKDNKLAECFIAPG